MRCLVRDFVTKELFWQKSLHVRVEKENRMNVKLNVKDVVEIIVTLLFSVTGMVDGRTFKMTFVLQ